MARALQQATRAGQPQPLLRGQRLALMAADGASAAAQLFSEAATRLGARVSGLAAAALREDDARLFGELARTLGGLYDAIECQGVPAADVRRLAAHATVPVFDNLTVTACRACEGEPQQAHEGTGDECPQYAVQAALLLSLAGR